MSNYARPVPIDKNGNPMQEFPPVASAIGTIVREDGSASSVTSLTANTTTVEVAAVTSGVFIRWAVNQASSVVSAAGTANFDHFVQSGTVRRFVVPRTTSGYQSLSGIGAPSITGLNTAEGLFNGIATKGVGGGSVLLTEY